MLRYLDAGESHGKKMVAIIDGFPSNVHIDKNNINRHLARRQKGYGRGQRMNIENDIIEIISGIRNEKTTGAPICIEINNKDMELFLNFNVLLTSRTVRIGEIYDKSVINMNDSDVLSRIENSTEPTVSRYERSDTCVVPALGIVCESVLSFELAKAFLEKFSGDSLNDIICSYHNYIKRIAGR